MLRELKSGTVLDQRLRDGLFRVASSTERYFSTGMSILPVVEIVLRSQALSVQAIDGSHRPLLHLVESGR